MSFGRHTTRHWCVNWNGPNLVASFTTAPPFTVNCVWELSPSAIGDRRAQCLRINRTFAQKMWIRLRSGLCRAARPVFVSYVTFNFQSFRIQAHTFTSVSSVMSRVLGCDFLWTLWMPRAGPIWSGVRCNAFTEIPEGPAYRRWSSLHQTHIAPPND